MTATIKNHEIFEWHERQKRGEIYICSLEVLPRGGYRLQYYERRLQPSQPELKNLLPSHEPTRPTEN